MLAYGNCAVITAPLHVIVLLAHMALCRIKAVEQLQYQPPGELGKLLGLDRVPEVRCLRHKLAALSVDDGPDKMGSDSVSRLAGGRAGTGWRAVCRWARSPLSWQSDRLAQTLYRPTAIVPAGDHRLLG